MKADDRPGPIRSPAPDRPDLAGSIASGARALGPIVTGLAVLSTMMPAIVGFAVLGFAGQIRPFFVTTTHAGAAAYAALFALTTGLALAPTYALSGVAGYIFGFQAGPIVAMVGVIGGAMIGYVLGLLLARERVMHVIERNERARIIRNALVDRGFWPELGVVTLIRLPPNSPFAITNLLLSSTRVRPSIYLLGTATGIAPRTIIAAVLGAQIALAQQAITEIANQPQWLKIAGIGASVLIVLTLYIVFSRWSKEALRKHLASGCVQNEEIPRPTE